VTVAVDPRVLKRIRARKEAQRIRAQGDASAMVEAILRDESGRPLKQAPFHREWQSTLDAHQRLVLFAPVEHGKCQPASAMVDLGNGSQVPITDVRPDQEVCSWDGWKAVPARAGSVFSDGHHEVLRFRFKSGRTLDVTAGHPLWIWWGWRRAGLVQVGDHVAVPYGVGPADPVGLDSDLAWLLGLLVGDGGLTTRHRVKLTIDDSGIVRHVRAVARRRGWKATQGNADPLAFSLTGEGPNDQRPVRYLFQDGWLDRVGSHDKLVPRVIHQADDQAVAAFLSGYLDADGTVYNGKCPNIEYYSVNRGLLVGVQKLLGRLGVPSRLAPKRGRYQGKPHHSWRLTITRELDRLIPILKCYSAKGEALASLPCRERPVGDLVPRYALDDLMTTADHLRWAHGIKLGGGRTISRASMIRSAEAMSNPWALRRAQARVWWDEVTAIEPQGRQEVFGLPVHGTHAYCSSGVITHNTIQVMVGRTLYELGTRLGAGAYPRILLVGRTQKQAGKPLGTVQAHIERNTDLHRVFPHLVRERFDRWTTSHIRYRPTRPTTAKDFTVEAVGIGGAVMGGRYDIAILDDILDLENTWTADQRFKAIEWFDSTIPGRIVEGGSIWIIGTAWHPADLMHVIGKRKGYVTRRYPAEIPARGKRKPTTLWPARWSLARLKARREELTPYRYAQQMLCKAVSDETSRFDLDWFARCIREGKGLPFPSPAGMEITVTGVDLGVKRKASNDETAIVTAGLDSLTHKRRILNILHGRWRKREIIARCGAVWRKYGGVFMVEDNAAQNYLTQDLQEDTPIPVWPYYTKGPRKHDPVFGIEGWGVELENRKWEIPADARGHVHDAIQLLIDQALEWKPTEHTGDVLMALYLALEGIRRHEMLGGGSIGVG